MIECFFVCQDPALYPLLQNRELTTDSLELGSAISAFQKEFASHGPPFDWTPEEARSYGRKFDEFLYDPNDELAKARAAFGKK